MKKTHLKLTSSPLCDSESLAQATSLKLEPESSFDWQFYSQYYEDLTYLSTYEEALEHWLTFGQPEGRLGSEDALQQFLALNQAKLPEDFHEEDYLTLNPDLHQSLAEHPYKKYRAIEHFLCYGKAEQRDYKFIIPGTFTQPVDSIQPSNNQTDNHQLYNAALNQYLQWGTDPEPQTVLSEVMLPKTLSETLVETLPETLLETSLLEAGLSAEIAQRRTATKSRILLIDTCKETHNHYIILAILDALQRHEDVEFVTLSDYQDALSTFVEARCDTLIAVGGSGGDCLILARLAALAKCSVLWTTEDPYELTNNVRLARCFDLVFTNDLSSVPAYGNKAKHLPLAASSKFHHLPVQQADDRYQYDLLFLGTAWPNRVKTINQILSQLKRPIRAKIGLPYNQFLPAPQLINSSFYTNWRTSSVNFAKLANRSRIVLCLFRNFSASSQIDASGSTPPPRLFEAALAGGFQLATHHGQEITHYFRPDKELVLCQDAAEIVAKIDYYLDHPDERIAIAAAAQAHTAANHLYDHRVAKLLNEVDRFRQSTSQTSINANSSISFTENASQNTSKHILIVTHNVLGHRPGGGVEVYQEQLQAIKGYIFSYLYPADASTYVVRRANGQEYSYSLGHLPTIDTFLHEQQREQVFQQILVDHQIDLVHFQHLLGYPLSLPLIAKAMGTPTIYTFHDYYLICKKFNLIDFRGQFCNIKEKTRVNCEVCLSADGFDLNSQARRRNFLHHVINSFDRIVVSTNYSKAYLTEIFYGINPKKVQIIEMMMPLQQKVRSNQHTTVTTSHLDVSSNKTKSVSKNLKKLMVAIPGNFTDVKGGHSMVRILNIMRNDTVEFHILGAIQEQFVQIFKALNIKNVTIHGGYQQDNIFNLLEGFDVSLHLSIWPETYMISLSEAWSMGLVPIVTNLGAQGERVQQGETGFKVAVDDIGAVIDCLRRLNSDRDYLATLKQNIKAIEIVKPAEHLEHLKHLYDSLTTQFPIPHGLRLLPQSEDFCLGLHGLSLRTNHPQWNVPDLIHDPELHPAPVIVSALIHQLPPEVLKLPKLVDSKQTCTFDSIIPDYGKPLENSGIVIAQRMLDFSGWVSDSDQLGTPSQMFVKLERGSTCKFASLRQEKHTDEINGFYGSLAVTGLLEGIYQVTLIQVYPTATIWLECDWQLFVGHPHRCPDVQQSTPFQTVFQTLPDALRQLPWKISGSTAQVRIDSIGDWQVGSSSGIDRLISVSQQQTSITGWAVDLQSLQVPPIVLLCLRSMETHQEWFIAAPRCRRPDVVEHLGEPAFAHAGFSAECQLENLPTGRYRLLVVQATDKQAIVADTGVNLLLKPSDPSLSSASLTSSTKTHDQHSQSQVRL